MPPGSRVATTSRPAAARCSASSAACVDFPEPSTPSNVTNTRTTIRRVRAVVTGGAGFVGSHLVDALVARGDEVTVIDNLSTGRRENVNPEAQLVEHDIREPFEFEADLSSTSPRRPTSSPRWSGRPTTPR